MNIEKNDDFDYTIVLDANYKGLEAAKTEKDTTAPEPDSAYIAISKEAIDLLYGEYEQMCLKLPTVLDSDDAYPRTYQWRIGDKYDSAKVEVIKEALRQGKKIADTEAYEKYVENIKNSGFKPDSWD